MRAFFTLLLFCFATAVFGLDSNSAHAFDYDQNTSLDIQEVSVELRSRVAVHDISFASPKGGRVPAYIVVPEGHGPFPAILWGHWSWHNSEFFNRKEFLDEAIALAHAGVVSLLPTGVGARPGHVDDPDPMSDRQIADLIQQIVDMRRGADLLLARKDVDPHRLAYVGHSYDGTVGGFLSGIDKRFKVFVLMAAGLSDEVDSKSDEFRQFRMKYGAEKFDARIAKYSWLDPGKFVSHAAPAAVFLQFATKEDFLTPDRARQYAANVSEPKKLKLYEAPHALNAEARRDRIAFLCDQLSIRPPAAVLIDAVPDLPQPPNEPPRQ